jgi:hypothetical protein
VPLALRDCVAVCAWLGVGDIVCDWLLVWLDVGAADGVELPDCVSVGVCVNDGDCVMVGDAAWLRE